MSSPEPHLDGQSPHSRGSEHPALCGAKMALVMATAGVVFVAGGFVGDLLFNSNRGLDWVIAEAKGSLKMFPLFGGFVGGAVGMTLGAKKSWQDFPLMTGGVGGALAGPVGMWFFVIFQIALSGEENLKLGVRPKFDTVGTIIFLAIVGVVLGICVGVITGWTYRTTQRSIPLAIGRATICAGLIGFLLAWKG